MTIRELLERVLPSSPEYDPKFAKMFRSLTKTLCVERELLADARAGDYKAAKKYFDSWTQLLNLFADDSRSLAALTVPKVKIRGKLRCQGDVIDLFPTTMTGTPTTGLYLYFLQPPATKPKRKPKPASPKYKTTSKKVKA